MNTRTNLFTVGVVILCAALVSGGCGGCAGQKARETVLTPALDLASLGVEVDAQRGLAALPEAERAASAAIIDSFFEVIATHDRARILAEAVPAWPAVEALAGAGIDAKLAAGDIGPNGAESLRERLRKYSEALAKLVERENP